MTQAEMIGYAAAVCVFLTFYMKTMIPLRVAGIVSNVFFIAYGYLALAYPVLFLHLILLPLNTMRLRQMLALVKQVRVATRDDLSMEWIKPFSTIREVRAGETLFHRGGTANEMFFIVSGRFRLTEIGIEIAHGQVVGELGFLTPDKARTGTLECVEPGRVLVITYDQVKQLYFQNPQFGFYFLQLTTGRLFENITNLERELARRPLAPAAAGPASS
ncbi:MAG TPA: cyclic nucleotide-binding domain-containing protein [Bradyrhizobium sp.]|nr:cyclic nucleotide-binding domain-containing protein [Bradyrhizobium sp.]